MTTQTEAFRDIASHFVTEWASRTPVFIDNGGEVGVAGISAEPDSGAWIHISSSMITSRQRTLGRKTNRKFRRDCVFTVIVRTDINSGTNESNMLVDACRIILEGERVGPNQDIVVNDVDAVRNGPSEKWYIQTVLADFNFSEIK